MHALGWLAAVVLSVAGTSAAGYQVSVKARVSGDAIASAGVPDEFPETGYLQAADQRVPFQKVGPNEIIFVDVSAISGQVRRYTVEPGATPETAKAAVASDSVAITVAGKPVLTYQGAETELPRPDIKPIYKRGGYIHPVLTPQGRLLTDDYPRNHLHHHGIWAPWTKTEFEGRKPDFWNMGEGKGRVEFVELVRSWSGPVCAGLVAKQRFVDLTSGEPKTALNELWELRVFALPGRDREPEYFVFDLVSTQTCATASPLKLPKYFYGGLGFRGNWDWNGEKNCSFLTANGETDRVKGNETRANWCFIGGQAGDGFAGITIFCHPDNFRAPQPMRLHPKEPFFCYAPSQLGDWAIEPGQPYVARYRFMVKDGSPVKSDFDQAWRSYAQPPEVTVTKE